MAMNSGKLYAGVARRGALTPRLQRPGLGLVIVVAAVVVAAVAALAAAAGVLGIPKYCVADLVEAEKSSGVPTGGGRLKPSEP